MPGRHNFWHKLVVYGHLKVGHPVSKAAARLLFENATVKAWLFANPTAKSFTQEGLDVFAAISELPDNHPLFQLVNRIVEGFATESKDIFDEWEKDPNDAGQTQKVQDAFEKKAKEVMDADVLCLGRLIHRVADCDALLTHIADSTASFKDKKGTAREGEPTARPLKRKLLAALNDGDSFCTRPNCFPAGKASQQKKESNMDDTAKNAAAPVKELGDYHMEWENESNPDDPMAAERFWTNYQSLDATVKNKFIVLFGGPKGSLERLKFIAAQPITSWSDILDAHLGGTQNKGAENVAHGILNSIGALIKRVESKLSKEPEEWDRTFVAIGESIEGYNAKLDAHDAKRRKEIAIKKAKRIEKKGTDWWFYGAVFGSILLVTIVGFIVKVGN